MEQITKATTIARDKFSKIVEGAEVILVLAAGARSKDEHRALGQKANEYLRVNRSYRGLGQELDIISARLTELRNTRYDALQPTLGAYEAVFTTVREEFDKLRFEPKDKQLTGVLGPEVSRIETVANQIYDALDSPASQNDSQNPVDTLREGALCKTLLLLTS